MALAKLLAKLHAKLLAKLLAKLRARPLACDGAARFAKGADDAPTATVEYVL